MTDTKRDYSHYDRRKRNKEAKQFYDSKAWQDVRAGTLFRDNNIDIYLYVTQNIVKQAEHVHHIVPRDDDKRQQYRLDNLISLTHSTHSLVERWYKESKAKKKETQSILLNCLEEFKKMIGEGDKKSL
jgi:5-methylcytosine-specific restriction protein A